MHKVIVAAFRCALMFLVPALAYTNSAQWDLNPTSGDWNTAANWTPMTVPNGSADFATFSLSNTTDVSISENTEVNSIVFTPAATNPYTIYAVGLTLTISGTGNTNDSEVAQNFVTLGNGVGGIVFSNSATAGSNVSIFNEGGGSTSFSNTSTAGNVFILNSSTGDTTFWDNSTAGSANIFGDDVSFTGFFGHSTAGNATIVGLGFIDFDDFSNAGSATINSAGILFFYGSIEFSQFSNAGNATLNSTGLSFLSFSDSSDGGTARIELGFDPELNEGAQLFIGDHNAPGVTIGSLEGDANTFVRLAANNLTVGSNNLNTTFSGVILDDGFSGSLTKIGKGTLALAGENTYTGITNVNRGVLQVDGSISSNTLVNDGGIFAGSGTVNGNVTNNAGKVSPGDALGVPGVLTVGDNYTQARGATLVIQIAGADAGQVSVLNVLGNAYLNGYLDPVLVNGFVPAIGQSFTFMNYASFTGFFSHIKDQPFDHGRKRWVLAYNPTSAVLFVVKNGPLSGSTSTTSKALGELDARRLACSR